MKRLVLVALPAVLLLASCVVPGRAIIVAPVPAPIVVTHVHGPHCGHFWGVWEGRPVYLHRGLYSYWNGAVWVERARPPVAYRTRVHHPDTRYHYHSRGTAPQGRWHSRQVAPPRQPAPHRAVPVE